MYCNTCITQVFRKDATCPECREPFLATHLVPDSKCQALTENIRDFEGEETRVENRLKEENAFLENKLKDVQEANAWLENKLRESPQSIEGLQTQQAQRTPARP